MNRYVFVNFVRTLRSSWRIYAMAVFMSAVAYGIFGVFFLAHRNIAATTRLWVNSVPVTLVLEHGLDRERQQSLLARARALGADEARLVTPDEGKRRLESSAGGAQLLAGFEENPLPPMIELRFGAPPAASETAALRAWPGVTEVDDAGRWSARFRALLLVLDRVGIFLGLALVLAAVIVSALAVRLVAANHTSEQEIQRLVGAPASFIRGPYLLAGLALGTSGAGAALAGLTALHRSASAVPVAEWPIPIHAPVFFAGGEVALILAGAALVGLAGSSLGFRGRMP